MPVIVKLTIFSLHVRLGILYPFVPISWTWIDWIGRVAVFGFRVSDPIHKLYLFCYWVMVQVLVRLTRIDPNNRTTVRNPISTSVKLPVSHRATAQSLCVGRARRVGRGRSDGWIYGQMRQPAQLKGEREQPEKLEGRAAWRATATGMSVVLYLLIDGLICLFGFWSNRIYRTDFFSVY